MPTGGTVDPMDLREEYSYRVQTTFSSSSYLFISHDCRKITFIENYCDQGDPFVTKICCDPRHKFALAAELQEGRVGRNEDLSWPCRKENTSRHV